MNLKTIDFRTCWIPHHQETLKPGLRIWKPGQWHKVASWSWVSEKFQDAAGRYDLHLSQRKSIYIIYIHIHVNKTEKEKYFPSFQTVGGILPRNSNSSRDPWRRRRNWKSGTPQEIRLLIAWAFNRNPGNAQGCAPTREEVVMARVPSLGPLGAADGLQCAWHPTSTDRFVESLNLIWILKGPAPHGRYGRSTTGPSHKGRRGEAWLR